MSDTVHLLEAAHEEYRHFASHEPGLQLRHRALAQFFEGRSAAITRGIQRARAGREARRGADTAPEEGPT